MTYDHIIRAFVVFSFTMSVLLEAAGAAARPAGALLGKNALGYTLLVMINTVKRTFLVIYPPLLGVLALQGGGDAVVQTIFACFAVSVMPLLLVTLARKRLIAACVVFISTYSEQGNIFKSIIQSLVILVSLNHNVVDSINFDLNNIEDNRSMFDFDIRLFILATVIQVFYTIALFAINLVGAYCAPYGPVVYQLTGLVTAVGTLIWAFSLDPQLSRKFDEGADIARTFHSLLLANWGCNVLLAPLLLWLILQAIWQISGTVCGIQSA